MNCHDIAVVLDEHGLESLAPELRSGIEAHAEFCAECRAVLDAERMLRCDPLPPMPPLDVVQLLAERCAEPGVRTEPIDSRRRVLALRPAVLGVLAVGGAALAALGLIPTGAFDERAGGGERAGGDQVYEPAPSAPASSVARQAEALAELGDPSARSLIDYVDAAEKTAADEFRAQLMSSPTPPDGDLFALLKVPPRYPQRAVGRALEGHAVVEFTVTAAGDVADPVIVESSHPIFEAPTLEAISKAKYKPRVVDGTAVAVEGIRNRFTYLVEDSAADERADGDVPPAPEPVGDLDWHEFRARLEPVLECVERSDLLCVELALDEIRAVHVLTPSQASELSRIYGFVYHRLGAYERAIAAYEDAAAPSGVEAAARTGSYFSQAWMTVARIHYERHRYQEALDAAIRYLREVESPTVADYVFVDRLRQLGAVVR